MPVRALVLYSAQGDLEGLARAVVAGLEKAGFRAEAVRADARSGGPIAVGLFDLICVGSPVIGTFGGQVAGDLGDVVRRMTRAEGKQAAAFVRPRLFGTTAALRRLMHLMEEQGLVIRDFAALRSVRDAQAFGQRLRWET